MDQYDVFKCLVSVHNLKIFSLLSEEERNQKIFTYTLFSLFKSLKLINHHQSTDPNDRHDSNCVNVPSFVKCAVKSFSPRFRVTRRVRTRRTWRFSRSSRFPLRPCVASWPGGLTRQAYSITETAPLFCRHGKNKRRALMRVQEAHLPDSLGPIPPGR